MIWASDEDRDSTVEIYLPGVRTGDGDSTGFDIGTGFGQYCPAIDNALIQSGGGTGPVKPRQP